MAGGGGGGGKIGGLGNFFVRAPGGPQKNFPGTIDFLHAPLVINNDRSLVVEEKTYKHPSKPPYFDKNKHPLRAIYIMRGLGQRI